MPLDIDGQVYGDPNDLRVIPRGGMPTPYTPEQQQGMFQDFSKPPEWGPGRIASTILGAPFNLLHGFDQELKGMLGIPTVEDAAARGRALYGQPQSDSRAFGAGIAEEPEFGDRFLGALTGKSRRQANAGFLTAMQARQRNLEARAARETIKDTQNMAENAYDLNEKQFDAQLRARYGAPSAEIDFLKKNQEYTNSVLAEQNARLNLLQGGQDLRRGALTMPDPVTGLTPDQARTQGNVEVDDARAARQLELDEAAAIREADAERRAADAERRLEDASRGLSAHREVDALRRTYKAERDAEIAKRLAEAPWDYNPFSGPTEKSVGADLDAELRRETGKIFRRYGLDDLANQYDPQPSSTPGVGPTPTPMPSLGGLTKEAVSGMTPEEKAQERLNREMEAAYGPSTPEATPVPGDERARIDNADRVKLETAKFDENMRRKRPHIQIGSPDYYRLLDLYLTKQGLARERLD